MLTASLQGITDYAQHAHREQWYIDRLPADLGARRFVRDVGPDLLGVAAQGRRRAIGLNAAIIGTPLELPVLAHECGHLLLGHDIGFCSLSLSAHVHEERAAWDSASVLAIPTDAAVMLVQRRATVPELADYYEVPRALVHMRGALAVLLGEADGDHTKARTALVASRRSLESWMARVARSI